MNLREKKNKEKQALKPPTFSKLSGFYSEDFNLTLKSEEEVIIYYTIDSTDPRNSSTSKEYKDSILIYDRTSEPNIFSAINGTDNSSVSISRGNIKPVQYTARPYLVDKAMIIRAVSKNSHGEYSEIESHTYFITNNNLYKYKEFLVVSLVTNPENLFDPDIGIYVTGTMYQNWINSEEYNPSGSPWDSTVKCNFFMKGEKWEREANLTIFENGILKLQQYIGISLKGKSSRAYPMKSFNLKARKKYGKSSIKTDLLKNNYDIEGNLITSYKSLSLRSVHYIDRLKEKIGRDLYYNRKELSPAEMIPSILFLDGEYWGLYLLMEKIDNDFFEENYLIPKKNISVIKNNEVEDGPEEELIKFQNFCLEYSKKDVSDLNIYKEINDFIDLDSLIELYAAELYILNEDWLLKNDGEWRNIGEKIEGNEYSDGKWRFIIFDIDFSMGKQMTYDFDNFNYTLSQYEDLPVVALFTNLLKNNKEFQNKFINVYCDYANDVFSSYKVNKLLSKYKEEEMAYLMENTFKRWDFDHSGQYNISIYRQQYFNTLNKISYFFGNRSDYALLHMKNFIGLNETIVDLNIEINGKGKIQINTIIPEIINGNWTGKYFTGIPILIKAIPDEGYIFNGWSGYIQSNKEIDEITLDESEKIIVDFNESDKQ